jgi:hypothetical protein
MIQQITTYDINEFVGPDGDKVYSVWVHFSNDECLQCGYYKTELEAKCRINDMKEFASKLLQAAKDSF